MISCASREIMRSSDDANRIGAWGTAKFKGQVKEHTQKQLGGLQETQQMKPQSRTFYRQSSFMQLQKSQQQTMEAATRQHQVVLERQHEVATLCRC